jgi:hypothetical protein
MGNSFSQPSEPTPAIRLPSSHELAAVNFGASFADSNLGGDLLVGKARNPERSNYFNVAGLSRVPCDALTENPRQWANVSTTLPCW